MKSRRTTSTSICRGTSTARRPKTCRTLRVSTQLGGLKGDRNAISEVIENNVRRKIVKEHLNDPAYYEKMSALLDEIIAARKAKAIEYEEYLAHCHPGREGGGRTC